ncbi:hypothetical protein G7Z17_g8672 [Cylindrodendrum hubeiense]|uniref:Uncharacterized protein n=1 Tax=Cylindrodendrum hubeiense TaxID=595255 RepID=A0A9P5HAR1_9HYPO|nr:hypothetical protein G7Z17_g8672 [Cylindrodendrum hubeiense]
MARTKDNQVKTGEDGAVCLPGFGLPLTYLPKGNFPTLVGVSGEGWTASTLTIREVCMLKLMEDITNKPEWWRKVNDPEIVTKWKKEAVEMPWSEYVEFGHFDESMVEACFEELSKKAEIYEKTGLIPVMDYCACAIKSDKLIPDDLREALKSAVAPLENVPAERLDWHPGSDGKVLDLVHPSLWPLLYGRSLILPDRRITKENCLEHCGTGVVVPEPTDEDQTTFRNKRINGLSSRFQWLPCDVDLTGEHPRIESYINNLHPIQHAGLYPIIEKFIEKALPAWDIVHRWPDEFQVERFDVKSVGTDCNAPNAPDGSDGCDGGQCYPYNRPVNEGEAPRDEDEPWEEWYEGSDRQRLDKAWFQETHKTFQPDFKENVNDRIVMNANHVKTSGFLDDASRIQVIVKLANIHLTPEKPTYDGGSWHIEGQINERICATALYYYDCDNITECRLDFRAPANREGLETDLGYAQDDHESIMRTFAIRSHEDTLQNIGSVLTRVDRMLFFPNLYQHHVSPFELADKTRPGHRKILAMFLVDPAVTIPSTANVPPQQLHWWAKSALPSDQVGRLPREVTEMVIDNMEFPISEKEAKQLREEVMSERTVLQEKTNRHLEHQQWNFCEH